MSSKSRRALVFLQHGAEAESYIGAKLIDPAPVLGARVVFAHEGRMLGGRVGSIHPENWNNGSELIPTIRIIGE